MAFQDATPTLGGFARHSEGDEFGKGLVLTSIYWLSGTGGSVYHGILINI